MEPIRADLSTILNRILDTAADNLRIAKILVQLGLDPNNVTYDALFNRLLEIFLHNITLANMFALVGAVFFVATLLTQTMVPLRIANMIGCAFFALFGALTASVIVRPGDFDPSVLPDHLVLHIVVSDDDGPDGSQSVCGDD